MELKSYQFKNPLIPVLGSEPAWTTWKFRHSTGDGGVSEKVEKKRCIDYIWYTPKTIRPKQVLDIPQVLNRI